MSYTAGVSSSVPIPEVPAALVTEIERGQCVAFLGAGYSAAAGLPGWDRLISEAASHLPEPHPVRRFVEHILHGGGVPNAADLDRAAQLLEDELTRPGLLAALLESLAGRRPTPRMELRQRFLRDIPFRAIVTTNFDPLTPGHTLAPDFYHSILRGQDWGWWSESFWGKGQGAPVIKIHGDLEAARDPRQDKVVLTRRDYRRLLYVEPGYQTFVRTLMASHTVLFLGFSFTDNYLNELRSEVMALFGSREVPLAYALLPDAPRPVVDHYWRHEGIHVLSYSPEEAHAAFDGWLEALWTQTALRERLRRRLAGRRILWLDLHHAENNGPGIAFLEDVLSGDAERLRTVARAEEALAELESFAPDLVLTHWGSVDAHDDAGRVCPAALRVLDGLRRRPEAPPVIVFTQGAADLEERRAAAFRRGAFDFCVRWDALLLAMERLFRPLAADLIRVSPRSAPG